MYSICSQHPASPDSLPHAASAAAAAAAQVALWTCRASNAEGALPSSAILDCFDLCSQTEGVKVVSASFGMDFYSQLQAQAVERLRDADILLVAAAGNGE
jgi:hypothetical protein